MMLWLDEMTNFDFQPAYFIYLLRSFCLSPSGQLEIKNFLALANAVIAVFVASLAPFALMGQIQQLLSRLFPFTRGLNHAYWAPNAWALVTAADRVLLRCSYIFFNDSFLHWPISRCEEHWEWGPYKFGGSGFNFKRACWRYCLCGASKHHAFAYVHDYNSSTVC